MVSLRDQRWLLKRHGIFALAVPTLGARIIEPSVVLVDTGFVGRLGATSLAALAINLPIFFAASFLFSFLVDGTTTLVAQASGRRSEDEVDSTVLATLGLAVLLGVATTVVLLIAGDAIITFLGAEGEVADEAGVYLRARAFAIPAFLVSLTCMGILRGLGDARSPLIVVSLLAATNIVLDALLIFGFGWGIAGAGIATAVSQWLAASTGLGFVLRARRCRVRRTSIPVRELRRLLFVGVQLTTRTGGLIVVLILATSVAAQGGEATLAAHQIAAQLWMFLTVAIESFAVALQVRVGHLYGADRGTEARLLARAMLWWAVALTPVVALVLYLSSPLTLPMFTQDPRVLTALRVPIAILSVMICLAVVAYMTDGAFMALGRFWYLTLAMLSSAAVACATMLVLARALSELTAVWLGLGLFVTIRMVLGLVCFARSPSFGAQVSSR